MRKIDHVHDAEHQRQPGGEQEQHETELQAVEGLFEDELGHGAEFMVLAKCVFDSSQKALGIFLMAHCQGMITQLLS
jgi:hypothetical protein